MPDARWRVEPAAAGSQGRQEGWQHQVEQDGEPSGTANWLFFIPESDGVGRAWPELGQGQGMGKAGRAPHPGTTGTPGWAQWPQRQPPRGASRGS